MFYLIRFTIVASKLYAFVSHSLLVFDWIKLNTVPQLIQSPKIVVFFALSMTPYKFTYPYTELTRKQNTYIIMYLWLIFAVTRTVQGE